MEDVALRRFIYEHVMKLRPNENSNELFYEDNDDGSGQVVHHINNFRPDVDLNHADQLLQDLGFVFEIYSFHSKQDLKEPDKVGIEIWHGGNEADSISFETQRNNLAYGIAKVVAIYFGWS